MVERLRGAGAAELAGQADWVAVEAGPSGEPGWFLRHRDGACVFLGPGNLCAIHAAWGGAAKPGFCQEFPFRRVRDPAGEVLVIRPECAGLHRSSVDGAPLVDQVADVAALPRLGPAPLFAPDAVAVVPGAGVGLDDWMRLEAALLRRWEAVDGAAQDPEETARGLFAAAVAAIGRPSPTGRPALAASAVRAAMGMVVDAALAQESATSEAWQRPLVRDVHRIVAADGPRRPLSDDARRYLHLLLGQALIGKRVASVGSLGALLGLVVFEADLVRCAPGDGPVTAAEASAVIVPWTRFTENPVVTAMLRRASPALLELASPGG